jgi:hypothetical protein
MKRTLAAILLLLLGVAAVFPAAYGGKVLALYKSSEGQTEKENEIFFYLSRPLQELGLKVSYWDIDRGLPPEWALADTRAIISWYRGPAMKDPEAYLEFLNRAVDQGVKLLVLDNFGAYQDSRSDKYLNPAQLNATLSRLGLLYLGDWTDDPAKISLGTKNANMVEWQGAQDTGSARFFYHFVPVDRELKVHLSLKRRDRGYGASPVITTNPNGGFALSRYIYRQERGKVRLLLNVEAFLREALFPPPGEELIGLLAQSGNAAASRVLDYTAAVLRRARLPFEIVPAAAFAALLPGDLRRFSAVGLILNDDAGLSAEVLESYLEDGGALVSLLGGRYDKLAPALGMSSRKGSPGPKQGYRFLDGFVLGEGLAPEDGTQDWKSGSNLPAKNAEVLATSVQARVPLLWTAARGAGKSLVWNWDLFDSGYFQGLILESFLYLRPVGAAVTAGLGLMFLDDWPLPMFNVVKPPLKVTDTEFYTRTWWPQIKELFGSRDIPFASYLIFNYNDRTSTPFIMGEFYVAEGLASVRMGEEILAAGGELGFHGYNHMSLTSGKTEVNLARWPTREAMEEGLREARREWVQLYGEHTLPFAYVAPNNIISDEGIAALRQVFPSIRVISALRAGKGEETYTEFGTYDKIDALYFIPRNSWGYLPTAGTLTRIASSLSGAGVWSHFIHADDLFDPYRSHGKSWPELKAGLEEMLAFTKRHYPWLRYVSVREAYEILTRIDRAGTAFRLEEDSLTVFTEPGLLIRVRLNDLRRVKRIEGARVLYTYRKMPTLILEATSKEIRLEF